MCRYRRSNAIDGRPSAGNGADLRESLASESSIKLAGRAVSGVVR